MPEPYTTVQAQERPQGWGYTVRFEHQGHQWTSGFVLAGSNAHEAHEAGLRSALSLLAVVTESAKLSH